MEVFLLVWFLYPNLSSSNVLAWCDWKCEALCLWWWIVQFRIYLFFFFLFILNIHNPFITNLQLCKIVIKLDNFTVPNTRILRKQREKKMAKREEQSKRIKNTFDFFFFKLFFYRFYFNIAFIIEDNINEWLWN